MQPLDIHVTHPARHHEHLGVELATPLEQPLHHLQRVQVRQIEILWPDMRIALIAK